MATTLALDLYHREHRRTLRPVPAETTLQAPAARSFDPTQGRAVGSHPYDDPTQGRKIGADPYDDVTRPR